jgi:hypothetical protein
MRVLNLNDLGFGDKGGHLFLIYHQQKERLAALASSAALGSVGLSNIP